MGARIVVDTNVLVSALGWSGAPNRVVRSCLERRHQLLSSAPLLAELERVLRYPKFQFSEQAITDYLAALAKVAELIAPQFRLNIVEPDPADDRVLECALAGHAEVIVTGDEHLAALGSFEGILILSPQSFWERHEGT